MNIGKTFISLIVAFFVVGALLVFQATRSSASSVVTPSELLASKENRTRIRLAGKVTNGPIDYQVEPSISLKFSVQDAQGDEVEGIPVVYEGLKPDMFASGRNVLIDGDFRSGTLFATNLLTQCPSKYEAQVPTKE